MFKVKFKQKSINLLRQKMMWTGQIVTSCIIQGKLFLKSLSILFYYFDQLFVYYFTRATLAEIQRFADIAPTAIAHKIMYDVDFHGFHFPKVFLFAIQYNYYYFFHEFKFHSKLGNKYCCQPNCLSQRSKVLEESWKIWPRTLPWRKWPLCRR